MFFNSWSGLLRVLIVGICAYVALVALLRISGKRTLSKMNAFDFVVTVALGSTLGTVLISKDVPLVEAVLAFALLIVLQLCVTWSAVRFPRIKKLIRSQPRLLLYKGRILDDAMRVERVTLDELHAAVRQAGKGALGEVEAVVLETTGDLAVVVGSAGGGDSSLGHTVQGPHRAAS